MKDAVIIGAGVNGLCIAKFLREAGADVTVLERSVEPDGCSFGNAGMIVPSHFTPLASPGMIAKGLSWMFRKRSPFYIKPRLSPDLAEWLWLFMKNANQRHVDECADLLLALHEESKRIYKSWSEDSGHAFGMEEKGILMLCKTEQGMKEEERTAIQAQKLGIDVQLLSPNELKLLDANGDYDVVGAAYYPDDAHLSPSLLMDWLRKEVAHRGVELRYGQEAISIKPGQVLLRSGAAIEAKHIILSAGVWTSAFLKKLNVSLPLQDGKGYSFMQSSISGGPSIPALLHEARVAVTPMEGQLRFSGTLELSGLNPVIRREKVDSISTAASRYFPTLSLSAPSNVWLGYRPCSPDGMPYIGPVMPSSPILVATGHGMMGLSLAPATARIIAGHILGESSTEPKLSPYRFKA